MISSEWFEVTSQKWLQVPVKREVAWSEGGNEHEKVQFEFMAGTFLRVNEHKNWVK